MARNCFFLEIGRLLLDLILQRIEIFVNLWEVRTAQAALEGRQGPAGVQPAAQANMPSEATHRPR